MEPYLRIHLRNAPAFLNSDFTSSIVIGWGGGRLGASPTAYTHLRTIQSVARIERMIAINTVR